MCKMISSAPDGSAGKRGEDVSAAMAIMPPLLRLIDEARRVGLTIVYIRTTHSEWTDTPSWIYRTSQKGGLSTCREGTWGAEFYDGIAPLPTERVVIKHRYSAFINTDLNTVLKARNIQSVLVCGVATNVCVETTARDAYMFDYYVTMIDDCSAAYEAKLHLGTLDNMRRHLAWSPRRTRLSKPGGTCRLSARRDFSGRSRSIRGHKKALAGNPARAF